MGRAGSKPANAEKSLLVGRGTSAAHSVGVAAKATAGGSPEADPLLLGLGVGRAFGAGVLAFQLVSKCVASPIVFGYESCPTRRSFSNLFHKDSYLILLALMMSATARNFCIAISSVAEGLLF